MFTENPQLFNWSDGECGIMLGVLGLSAPFVNQGVASLARRASDRIITVGGKIDMHMEGLLARWKAQRASLRPRQLGCC